MNTISFSHTLFVLICFFISSCSKDISNPYFPLKEGMTWMYKVEQLTLTAPVHYRMIMSNLGSKKVDDKNWFVKKLQNKSLQYYNEDSEGVYRLPDRKEENKNEFEQLLPEKLYLYRYPLQQGTKWEAMSTPFLMERSIDEINAEQNSMPGLSQNSPLKMQYVIESLDETVTVPAGKFNGCMKVVGTGSCSFASIGSFAKKIVVDVKNTDWYCPDVGLVKVQRDENSDRVSLDSVYYTIELQELRH